MDNILILTGMARASFSKFFRHFAGPCAVASLRRIAVLVLLCSAPQLSWGQTADENLRIKLLNQRELVAEDDQYVARLFRGMMKIHHEPNWLNVDMTLMNDVQVSSSVFADFGSEPYGFLLGYQVYVLNSRVKDVNGGNELAVGYNAFGGVDLYLKEFRTTIFTGAYFSVARIRGGSLSRSEIDKAAVSGKMPGLKISDVIVPYFFIKSPFTDWFKASGDFSFERSSISRMGLAAFLRFAGLQGFEVGSTYDSLRVISGTMYDVGLEGRLNLSEKGDSTPPIRLKYGKVFIVAGNDSFNSKLNESESTYLLAEVLYHNFVLGISHKSPEGIGYRMGVKSDIEKMILTLTFQHDYIFDTVYGTRIDPWSIYLDMKWNF